MKGINLRVRKTKKAPSYRLKNPALKFKTKKTFLNYNWKQTKKRFPKLNPMG
ncbi:unnamed protein product, partial [marine sediment metagenome]